MANPTSVARRMLGRLRHEVRRRLLEAGEAGWGKPVPRPAQLRGPAASRTFRVGVIGAGAQGVALCQGMLAMRGIEIAGIADLDPARLGPAAARLGLPVSARYNDAARLLEETAPLDLVCVATTAPSHVKLGRLAIRSGA